MSWNNSGPVAYDSASVMSAASNTSDLTLAFPSNIAVGDMLLAVIEWYSANTLAGLTFTDSLGNTWTPVYSITQGANVGGHALYWCKSASAGPNTVTFHASTGCGKSIIIARLPGQSTTSLDTSLTATGNNGMNMVSVNITPANAGNLLVATAQADGGGGTNWTWAGPQWQMIATTAGNAPNDPTALAIQTAPNTSPVGSMFRAATTSNPWCTGIASFNHPGPAIAAAGSILISQKRIVR